MEIDLEKLLRARGKRAELKIEMPSFPKSFEQELVSIYREVTALWSKAVIRQLIEEYKGELQARDSVETVLNSVDYEMVRAMVTFTRRFREWYERGTQMHYRLLMSRLRYATGIDLTDIIPLTSPTDTLEDLLNWNTELIRNINEQTRQRIASAVYSGFTNRTPVNTITREIREATGMSTARARRIASDQTVKLSSALDDQRLKALGMEGYEWMHSGKLHPRVEHKARDGNYYEFGSSVDKTDAPGRAPFCGCKRRMVINHGGQ